MVPDSDPVQFNPGDDQEHPIPGEAHAPVPLWLNILYVLTLAWGFLWLYLFWNGSAVPWFDRGAWWGLQHAAQTTYPWKSKPELLKEERAEKAQGDRI